VSENEIRTHLRQALAYVIDAERRRVSTELEGVNQRIARSIEAMKPIIKMILALKEEIGTVEGLKIRPADHGHMATIETDDGATQESFSISTNYENSAFEIDVSTFCGSFHEKIEMYNSVEDVMTRVVNVVGKHIGKQQAKQASKNA
jgi:hypothetical protein